MTIKYEPQKVVDWVTPLEQVYARQSEQLERHHQQLRERDKQEQDATIDVPEIFAKLKEFSGTIASAVKTGKAAKEKEDTKNINLIKTKLAKLGESPDPKEQARLLNYATTEIDLKTEFAKLEKEVKTSVSEDRTPPGYADLILANAGGNIVYLQQIRAQKILDNGIRVVNSGFDGDDEATRQHQRDWRGLLQTKNVPGQKAFIEKYLYNELKSIGINDETIAAKYINQITTFSNNKGTLSAIKIKNNLLTADNITSKDKIDTVRKSGGNLAHEISLQIQGSNKDTVLLHLFGQADSGDLKDHEIAAMRTGYIEHAAGTITVTEKNKEQYPGFKVGAKLGTGELLFTDADGKSKWNQLEARVTAYNTAVNNAAKAANKATLVNATAGIRNGDIPIEQKDQILGQYIRNGGKDTDAEYEAFENVTRYDPDLAKVEGARTNEIWTTGRPRQYEGEVKNMSQVDYDIWNKKTEAYEANREQNGFGKKTSEDFATRILQNKILGNDITIDGKKLTPGTQEEIRDFISAKADKIYMKHYMNPDIARDQIDEETEKELNAWLATKGAFVKSNDTENVDRGILTPDGQGGFPGWEAQNNAKIEQTKGSHPKRTIRNLLNEYKEHKTRDNILKNGRGITNAELLAVIRNVKNDKLTAIPPDILLKARFLGVQPSQLILSKIEHLEKSKALNDTNFKNRFDLDLTTLKTQIPAGDMKIREIIKGVNDGKTLLNHYDKVGLEGFSPKMNAQMFEAVLKKNEDIRSRGARLEKLGLKNVDREILESPEKVNRMERLATLDIKDYPKEILDSDEAVDKYITQMGVLEPK
tara:strand:+ start:840 stop:3290 length:2451 start_codon:yes stop_codon:yes gene_type:complete